VARQFKAVLISFDEEMMNKVKLLNTEKTK